LVAEGPALKFFERLQAEQIEEDLAVMWRVVEAAVDSGRLPREALVQIDIQSSPPSLAVRDHLREAQVYKLEHAAGILSPQTWSQKRGLDYDQEQANLAAHGAPRVPASVR
jgi:hypothetical protein